MSHRTGTMMPRVNDLERQAAGGYRGSFSRRRPRRPHEATRTWVTTFRLSPPASILRRAEADDESQSSGALLTDLGTLARHDTVGRAGANKNRMGEFRDSSNRRSTDIHRDPTSAASRFCPTS